MAALLGTSNYLSGVHQCRPLICCGIICLTLHDPVEWQTGISSSNYVFWPWLFRATTITSYTLSKYKLLLSRYKLDLRKYKLMLSNYSLTLLKYMLYLLNNNLNLTSISTKNILCFNSYNLCLNHSVTCSMPFGAMSRHKTELCPSNNLYLISTGLTCVATQLGCFIIISSHM